MNFNPVNAQMSSETTSLKIWLENTGSFQIPSTNSTISTTVPIAHGYLSDNLIWQVGISWNLNGSSQQYGNITPWETGDGQYNFTSELDSNNLYIIGTASTVGTPTILVNANYYYRILVP